MIRFAAWFYCISVIHSFLWFWMGGLCKCVVFMLGFLKALLFFYCCFFLLNINDPPFKNSNLSFQTLWIVARNCMLISILGKLNLCHLIAQIKSFAPKFSFFSLLVLSKTFEKENFDLKSHNCYSKVCTQRSLYPNTKLIL